MAGVNKNVYSGNIIAIKFDTSVVGLLSNVNLSDDYSPQPASGIGDIHVVEWVPSEARHTINASQGILFGKSLRNVGFAPENGDEVLKGTVFDIVQYDRETGEILRKYINCSYASGSTEIAKHSIVMNNAVFNAIDVSGLGL